MGLCATLTAFLGYQISFLSLWSGPEASITIGSSTGTFLSHDLRMIELEMGDQLLQPMLDLLRMRQTSPSPSFRFIGSVVNESIW